MCRQSLLISQKTDWQQKRLRQLLFVVAFMLFSRGKDRNLKPPAATPEYVQHLHAFRPLRHTGGRTQWTFTGLAISSPSFASTSQKRIP